MATASQSDPDWMLRYIESRFGRDPEGRMNPSTGCDACIPDFVLARSRQGNIWRFSADLHDTVVRDLARLAGREPAIPKPTPELPPPERLEPFCAVLRSAKRGDQFEWRGLYRQASTSEVEFQLRGEAVHLSLQASAEISQLKDSPPSLCSVNWKDAGNAQILTSKGFTLFADLILIHNQRDLAAPPNPRETL